MKENYSSLLNPSQAEAVGSSEGPLLIIAGAGSGKTRVITYKIAHLLDAGVPQSEILAVTFTNKAAREMAQRIRSIVPRKLSRLTVCTFHAFGAQILREKHGLLGYRANFSIHDSQDQAALLRETSRELGAKGESLDLVAASQVISAVKTGRVSWTADNNQFRKLFKEYQKNLRLYNAVDFDDLIILPHQLFESQPDVQKEFQARFRYLLVDEFQDTSSAQYSLMRALVGPDENVCVVGDDDQSIYSWRGASYENIVRFEKDFPRAKLITLEQNYRSTKTILRAANALISGNALRKKKTLWTGLPEGERIEEYAAETEVDEAEFIASRIKTLMIRDSFHFDDFGVLLRANHLTRAIEESFRKESIPYLVSGGMSFFERQEVRDMLAYLKLFANPDNDTSLLRIVNTPRRGIGRKLLEKTAEHATEHHCSMFSALAALGQQAGLGLEEKSMAAAAEFTTLVEEYRTRFLAARGGPRTARRAQSAEGRGAKSAGSRGGLSQALRGLVEEIDYWGHLVMENKDARDKDVVKWKFGNVESLVGSIADYEEDPDIHDPSLFDYLSRVSLASRDDVDSQEEGGRVNIMTIHAAKGLEFPVVFVAGVEKDIIPHVRSVEEADANLEEERRLFYVALTRARTRLFLTFCSSRRRMGKPSEAFPSPFLDEIPPDCVTVPVEDTSFVPDFQNAWKKIARD